ncbi:hypothetical protein BDU57DRAFT_589235 [Ampelomyces quisqualis]|uniref:Autophagy-related protein 29 n=1 Tax=Ampelomyces quisqualis TaxID=50730 RepID=A0A6A5QDZ5_AMPQU|nr:hypothetical protein BDU57DRAFT_589235 [Ampelomyces quisqualis]
MFPVQFTTVIRLPFARGSFEDPPQAQWDTDKDRQLWKVISKSSKTSDLNWVEIADKFQVPPTFLLQQAAWLYERHLDHVRNQMKKVSGSNIPTTSTSGASTLTATGGVAMLRTGSGGSGASRTTSALSGQRRESPSLRGGEPIVAAPPLSRNPSTNTITQSRANTQQPPVRTQSTRSVNRPNLASSKLVEHRLSTTAPPPIPSKNSPESPGNPSSTSSSSSSSSDIDHPVHRSQLFKRPPRFKQQPPRGLLTFEEGDGTHGIDDSGSHGGPTLPFASAARQTTNTNRPEHQNLQPDRSTDAPPTREKSIDQQSRDTTETASSMTTSASESDAPVPNSSAKIPVSPPSNHRAELGRLGGARQKGPRSRKEGSEGTPSMGSSFSDIDDAGISQSALEEALLSNMQHGRMSSLSHYTQEPPITTHYHNATVTLDFSAIYTSTKHLLSHPPCLHRPTADNWPCPACSSAFTAPYWSSAASLLDYFADFHGSDNATMSSIWFHLLDIWQEAYLWFPLKHALSTRAVTPLAVAEFTAARWLMTDFTSTMGLFDRLLHGARGGAQQQGEETSILHDPTGEKDSPVGKYDTGPWVSGLDAWAQFLAPSGPGVCAADADEEDHGDGTRFVPQAAIALIATHTQRARRIAARLFLDDADSLHEFDRNCLAFPRSKNPGDECTFRSLDGQLATYRLVNGAPPIMRYSGYGDPGMTCDKPTYNLLDECVALCRGVEAYEPVSGEGRNDDDEEGESEDEDEDEDEEVFDMLLLYMSSYHLLVVLHLPTNSWTVAMHRY